MAGARQPTALPPRERPGRPRSPGLPRPAPPPPARGRGGTAPPHPSEAGPRPSRFRARSGGDSVAVVVPPPPAAHPLAVGLHRCLRPQRAPVCGSRGGCAPRRGMPRAPNSPARLPPAPAVAARGPCGALRQGRVSFVCDCRAAAAPALRARRGLRSPPAPAARSITAAFWRDLNLLARCP